MINIEEEDKFTQIYLVENCYGDENKVYIGKERSNSKNKREYNHRITYGKDIIFSYIDKVDSLLYECWEPLETFWINYFQFLGFQVLNKRKKGGSGPICCSTETREKISQANKGKPKPESFKEKMRKPREEWVKEKLRKPKSEEYKQNLRKPRPGSGEKIKQNRDDIKWRESITKSNGVKIKQQDLEGNLIQSFDSMSIAARHLISTTHPNMTHGGLVNGIKNCCKGIYKTCAGFKWEYY